MRLQGHLGDGLMDVHNGQDGVLLEEGIVLLPFGEVQLHLLRHRHVGVLEVHFGHTAFAALPRMS